jgi:hypothetical protein
MNKFILTFFFSVLTFLVNAQQNCGNPLPITICPPTTLTNQTNALMLDDAPVSCNVSGEDVVYEISAPSGAISIYVQLLNCTGPGLLTLKTGTCNSLSNQTRNFWPGNQTFTFSVTQSNFYYLIVDAASTITYDLNLGGDTAVTTVNIPNTQGLLDFSGCLADSFSAQKPFLHVEYNGVTMYNPMTLAPLFATGTMCATIALKNATGVKGPKYFQFSFPTGILNPVPVPPSFPGTYRAGTWTATYTATSILYQFSDSLGLGYGDFNGPNNCASYTFCFDIFPISNDPALTNITVDIVSDNNGAGYSGVQYFGCCPAGLNLCSRASGSAIGGTTGLGFGFADPGGSLPVALTNFSATGSSGNVLLKWMTSTEINNEFFTLERSTDGAIWSYISRIEGHGNSSHNNTYSYIDTKPGNGIIYYRVSQTDFDGTTVYYEPVSLLLKRDDVTVYPNPSSERFYISGEFEAAEIRMENILGEVVLPVDVSLRSQLITVETTGLRPGTYFLRIVLFSGEVITRKILVE